MSSRVDERAALERPTYLEAMGRLRASQKSSKGAPAYSRYVNRPLGRIFAAAAATAGLTPNQVTLISAAVTGAGIALIALAPPSMLVAVAVAALLMLGYALDAADGQLARLRGGGTLAGEWLDHVVDAAKTSLLHAAVLVSWARFSGLDEPWLLVPVGFLVVAAVFFFGVILTDLVRRMHRGSPGMILDRPGKTSLLYSLAVLPADYGFLCLTFLTLASTPVFTALYTVLFVANALILPASLLRWFRELSRLG